MKETAPPAHTLPAFAGYLRKVFQFPGALARLTDARHDSEIAPRTAFLALFYGFAFRLSSFQQLEAEVAHPRFQRWIDAPAPLGMMSCATACAV